MAGVNRRHGVFRAIRLGVVVGLLGGALVAAPGAQSRGTASLILYVYFGYNNDISVKLADGTSIGTSSGPPTVIPAGDYTVALEQPGCVQVPSFELQGPGVNIVSNLSGGEVTSATDPATFLPSSTYTWRNDANRAVVNTFVTSSTVVGTPPPSPLGIAASGASTNKPTTNTGVVGADVVPFRGTLEGTVTAAGKLILAFRGRRVTTLRAGRYRITVSEPGAGNGFMLQTTTHRTVSLPRTTLAGTRTGLVDLTPGRWLFMPRRGTTAVTVVVT